MKAFLTDVFHHGKVKFKLVQFNFITLLIFEALYTLIGSLVIYPGSLFLLNKAMSLLGFPFLSDANIGLVLTNPLGLLALLLFILVLGFYGLFELTTLIVLFNESHFQRPVRLLTLCKKGVERAIRIVKPRNFPLIIFVLIIIPFTEFSLASSFVNEVKIPEFIMANIFASPLWTLSYFILLIGLFLLVMWGIFSIHYFTLEDQPFIQAIKKSRTLIKGHFWHTAFWVAFWNAAILLLLAMLFGILEVVAFFVLGQLLNDTLAVSIFIGFFGFFVSAIFTTFQLIETAITFALVSMFYYDYSQRAPCDVSSTALIETKNNRNKTDKPRKKLFIGLSMMTIFLIIAVDTYFIYMNFDDTFNSHFVEGPKITAQSSPSASASKNSLSTLQKAIDDGADYVQINVAQSQDGVIVVAEPTIKGPSGEPINIWETDVAALKNADVLTLSDVILFCKDKIKLNIQLNPTGHETSLVESTIAVINQTNYRDWCILASQNYPVLEQAAGVDPQIRRTCVTSMAMGDIQTLPVNALSVEASFIGPKIVTAIHGENKEIFAWTVNSEESITEMIHLGVDNIITQDVSAVKDVIHQNTEPRDLIQQLNDFLFKDIE